MQQPSEEHLTALGEYLNKNFGVVDMYLTTPFLILRCGDEPPTFYTRPFSVAGCMAVWIGIDDQVPSVQPGNMSATDDIFSLLELNAEILSDLEPYGMPNPETLMRIVTNHFPSAIGVSFICTTLIIEFQKIDDDAWRERLQQFPFAIKDSTVALNFSNGPLTDTEFMRLKKPNPRTASEEDDSDYVKSQGCFYPGTMLSSASGNQISAGVLVRKEDDVRLTVAFHCWDDEFAKTPGKLGNPEHFSITQGETKVGHVVERIGTTDIGLAKINDGVNFSNRFLDIEATAKTLVPLREVTQKDTFVIDSFVTGRQALRCAGKRIVLKEGASSYLKGSSENLPLPGKYLWLHQGVWATNAPEILGTPRLRAGVCGASIVRAREGAVNVLDKGQVCAFMHWTDLQMKYNVAGELFCFADGVDELIEAGWECLPVGEKRGCQDEQDPAERTPTRKMG